MQLVEVVRGSATGDAALATGLATVRRLGKTPVVANAAPGCIGNAVFADYRRLCELLVEDGAWPEEVDAPLEVFGFAMGPFRVFDLAGLDIAWRARRAQAPLPGLRQSQLADRLCAAGRFGQKAGAGWYRYPEGGGRAVPDPEVRALIEAVAAAAGIDRRPIPAAAIVELALAAMVNRAALLVAAGTARRAADIDVVMANGYGFPRRRGGPVFWASRQEAAALRRVLERLATIMGPGLARGDVPALLAGLDSRG
jgi:3-hydroxyacyl-CoA dehydrogenase